MLDARTPDKRRSPVQFAQGVIGGNIRHQFFSDIPEGRPFGRKINPSVNRSRLFPLLLANLDEKHPRIDRHAELTGGINQMHRAADNGEVRAPEMFEHPAGGGGLAKHGECGLAAIDCLQKTENHPFRNIEVAFAGLGRKTPLPFEVGFGG